MGAQKNGGLQRRTNLFTDHVIMLIVSGLVAIHEDIRATEETRKKRDEAQIHGTYMKEEASLW